MKRHRLLALLVTVLGLLGFGDAVMAAEPAEEHVPFHSMMGLRTREVVLQKLDFSCGAASLATLATYFLGKPTTEEAALRIIRARYTPDEWKKKKQDGLSMEDLAYMAEKLGLEAEGARVGLAGLLKLKGPVIVHFNAGGKFQHFSVLRGIYGTTAYLADPAFGRVPMSMGAFVDQFTGAVLAVWDPAQKVPQEYSLRLGEKDHAHDRMYDMVRPTLYNRPQPLGPGFGSP